MNIMCYKCEINVCTAMCSHHVWIFPMLATIKNGNQPDCAGFTVFTGNESYIKLPICRPSCNYSFSCFIIVLRVKVIGTNFH